MNRIAVVKVRGNIGVSQKVRDTMAMMGLAQVNHCAIIDDRVNYRGMLQKAKDYITWGEPSAEIVKEMLQKRGKVTNELVAKETKYKTVDEFVDAFMKFEVEMDSLKMGKVFRLSPPRKGYAAIKKQFAKHGSLGNRGKEINKLLARMI